LDKTLEIVMVAVALIIAAVIVVGLLQGQVNMFGGFSSNQTESSGCGISKAQFCNSVDSSSTTSVSSGNRPYNIATKNSQCAWSDGSSTTPNDVCG
jgi:hypothetical protein